MEMRVEVQAGTTPSHAAPHNHNKYVDRDQPRNASSRTAPADADAADDGDANYVGDSGTGKRSGHQQKWQYWEVLMRYADGLDMAFMGLGSLAALVDGLTLPAMLLIQSHLIHNLETLHDTPAHLVSAVSQNCLLFVYVALVSWIASCLEVSCWMQAGERQTTRIRAKYLQAVLRQDAVFFECEISTAEVINSISLDVALLQDSISEKVGIFVKNVAHFAGGYMVAFFQIWRIALLMIPFTPFFLLPGILYSKTISGSALEIRTSNEKSNTIAEQALSSIRTIYAFVAEEETIKSYTESLKKLVELGRKQGSIKGLAVGSNGLIFAVWAFLGWYGTALIVSGEANGGQLLTTGFAVVTGGLALGNALCYVKVFSDGCTAAQRIFQIIDRVPSIDINSTDGKILEVVEGKVEFRNVSFVYPSRVAVPVLQKLSLEFCPGKIAAIVGDTGSGKSTIISLIQRFYDPLSGAVFLDGFNIKELHLKWLRQIMGLVSQEPALFATSILNNLLHGKEDASMDEIVAAATLSGAHNFIVKLPNGYDTQVGERGIQMSGGQKQCIAIARAILRNPIILLLDEATSALDAESEALVNQALQKATWGRTTVLVAHRISTIKSADTIIVLQNGSVAEIVKTSELPDPIDNTSIGLSAVLSQIHQNEPQSDDLEEKLKENNHKNCDLYPNEEYNSLAEAKTENTEGQSALFWKLLCLSRCEWKQGLWGLLGALGYGLIQPIYAYLIGELASTYYLQNNDKRQYQIRICSLVFGCLSISFLVTNLVQHYNFFVLGENLTCKIREALVRKFLTFEMGWFDEDENSSGALCSRLASDSNTVKALLAERISLLVQTAFTVLVSAIIALSTSWRLALVMIAMQPLVIYAYFYRNRSLAEFAKQEAHARQEAGQLAGEAVSMQKTVTSFCMQKQILSSFESKLEKTKKKMSKRSYQAGMGIGIAQFMLFASWALDFWYGGQLVKSHKSTAGDVFKTFYVLVSTGRMLAEAGMLTPDVGKASAALDFIFKIFNRATQIDSENQMGEKVEVINGEIEFKNVSFCYPSRPRMMIFRNFNLKVIAGTSLALVGQSGSGKSTIVGLIERFYDPLQGQVMIDGLDIRSMHLRMLRQHIGLVSQEPSLFATTIRENILLGKPESSEDEIIKAACAANAHSFISALPEGYSSSVGRLGLQLSGGQKQRIAIARAILKNPRILLLDEATSALDCDTEKQVQNALNAIMVGRTSVVIAHRLSTIREAHCIAVLHNGSIMEQGTHSQLLAKGQAGAYFSLVHSQIAAPLSENSTPFHI